MRLGKYLAGKVGLCVRERSRERDTEREREREREETQRGMCEAWMWELDDIWVSMSEWVFEYLEWRYDRVCDAFVWCRESYIYIYIYMCVLCVYKYGGGETESKICVRKKKLLLKCWCEVNVTEHEIKWWMWVCVLMW